MTLCNFCNKRESRSVVFEKPFVCKECCSNNDNYFDVNDNSIVFIDSSNKRYEITADTDVDIAITHSSTANNSMIDRNNINEHPITEHIINTEPPINTEQFRDALLASLYSQVEFLRSQLEEKDFLIRSLLIKESDVYNHNSNDSCNDHRECIPPKINCTLTNSTASIDINETADDTADNSCLKTLNDEHKQRVNDGLQTQLKEIRKQKHNLFQGQKDENNQSANTSYPSTKTINREKKFETNYFYNEQEITNPNEIWPANTVLIIGDSMINQMDQKRLSSSTQKSVKIRAFGGAGIKEVYSKLECLLKKKPRNIIIHVGTADSVHQTSDCIADNYVKLKQYIEEKVPGIGVTFSCPSIRTDNSKARLTILRLVEKIKSLNVNYLSNVNIGENCLGVKGLHLTPRGVGRFAANLISLIRGL